MPSKMRMIKKFVLLILLFTAIFAKNAQIHHELNATINPSESFIEITDIITIPESQLQDGLEFKLHHALDIVPNKSPIFPPA